MNSSIIVGGKAMVVLCIIYEL